MKNVYGQFGHLQKIIGETFLTVSAWDSDTLQCPKKFTSVAAIKLAQTDGTFYQNILNIVSELNAIFLTLHVVSFIFS